MSAPATMAEPPTVKGWCPGAVRPMQTGDGLIVRVRPRCGTLSVAQALAVSGIAGRHGNGLIDLTRRANLQIRGLAARDLPLVRAALAEAGLMDAHAAAEAVRNVLVSPLAGADPTEICDVRPIAAALEAALTGTPALWALPGKFGFAVDGGGLTPLDGERADIRLKAVLCSGGIKIAIGIDTAQDTHWLRLLETEAAHAAAVRLAAAFVALPKRQPRARMRGLDRADARALEAALGACGVPVAEIAAADNSGHGRVGLVAARGAAVAAGLGAPFGRLAAPALARIAETAGALGITALRASPWRTLYVPVDDDRAAQRLLEAAEACGLVTAPDDPLMAIDACPGAPACRSACADTRAAARHIAAMMPLPGIASVHVSGCAKGCARSSPADLVLVASPAGFGIVRDALAAAQPTARLAAADLDTLPAVLRAGA